MLTITKQFSHQNPIPASSDAGISPVGFLPVEPDHSKSLRDSVR